MTNKKQLDYPKLDVFRIAAAISREAEKQVIESGQGAILSESSYVQACLECAQEFVEKAQTSQCVTSK